MKKIINNLVVGAFVIVGVSWCTLSIVELNNISTNVIDNKNKVMHNVTYDIENYKNSRDILGVNSYYEIKKGAEERYLKKIELYEKQLADKAEQERLRKVRQEELEKKRLARQKEKENQVATISRGTGIQRDYEATFYTSSCKGCTGQSSSGEWVNKSVYYNGMRIVAAPPNIPFYTIMRITLNDGSKMDAIVLDRGGDIGVGRLDILVESKEEAFRLGRQKVKVEIIQMGK